VAGFLKQSSHGFLKFISDKSFAPRSTRHSPAPTRDGAQAPSGGVRLRARFAWQIEGRSPRKSENVAGFALLAVPFGNLKAGTAILRKPSQSSGFLRVKSKDNVTEAQSMGQLSERLSLSNILFDPTRRVEF
jgi:hypothetical protein